MPGIKKKKPAKRVGLLAGFFMGLSLALPGACATPPPSDRQPELTFNHLAPIRLGVDRIEIVHAYAPPLRAPNVEHLLSTPPMDAAKRWAEERLRASVGPATARFTIRDAKVIEEKLPTTGGFLGYFTVEQGARYDATLDVLLEIIDGKGKRIAFAEAAAHYSQTVPEDASINERENYWFQLTENLLKTFDQEMGAAIQSHLAGFLR
ncbi:MAG: hypothetical protein J4G10_08245 [Alphaproteobacteria bacterium]|nr:hypothetical protein [Alphaproteobacteria bacterium]